MAANWKGGASGAAGGALSGAALGSSFAPGIGTAIGAGIGGIGGLLSGLFGGTKEGGMKRPEMTPQEQQYFGAAGQRGLGILQNPYQGFEPIAQRANSQFFQNTLPRIGEQFTGGTGGALSSPALNYQGQQAGVDLQERLAALQAQYGLSNQQNGLQYLQLAMQPYNNQYYQQPNPGFGGQLFNAGAQSLPLLSESLKGQDLRSNWNNFFGRGGQPGTQGQSGAVQANDQMQGAGNGYGQGYFQQQNPFMGQGGNFRVNPFYNQGGIA